MATAEEMAAYTQRLISHTSAQDKPVTEIAVFKLNPAFATDHAAAAAEFESQIIEQTAPGKPYAKGIRRVSWGFSKDDPETFVWMLDWDKIQDHWEFWQTPGFQPVISTINKLFVPGRPLVRHYDFGEPGMIETAWIRLFVWDEKKEGATPEAAYGKVMKTNAPRTATGERQAYAVDVDEMTWYCLLLGFENETGAAKAEVQSGFDGEDHIVQLKYLNKP
ncbi:hypothetical protein JX265_013298 [Neoarthrinium moseri]|uniref:Dimeric alpha-beta barrel n=1 Tax=Neoarthrinium moseri TaxID=1658444 RepID=A0A9P9W8S2_9PEZI|nr:uncharacterized protein JN550_013338 [Neoarthrinium moseri]KAI1843416.1 hypothetical protein JX266_010413 [Neoarthrinium moseri]KAI1850818.1 hypothetical protein JX265_013298 [Neoarthrinium moseri]KAI1857255.1 hypothetical protein JN550_013338 [Neoarthrinium moseri]